MYDAKQAKEDYEIAIDNKFRDYWVNGKIKAYRIEKLIKEASLRGKRSLSLIFVLCREDYSLYFGTTAESEESFEDFVSCLEYYGYDVSLPPCMCNGDVEKTDITISW